MVNIVVFSARLRGQASYSSIEDSGKVRSCHGIDLAWSNVHMPEGLGKQL